MGFLTRLRDAVFNNPSMPLPDDTDDTEMSKALTAAKRANKKASEVLNAAVKKQGKDALFVRQVISDVLDRTEKGNANARNR